MATFSFKSSGKTAAITAETATISQVRSPVGIKTPLQMSDKSIFAMHYDLADQVHDNLKNLILTNWGERVGLYYFGANLRELTTEFSDLDAFDEAAINRIRTAVKTWMPFVTLKNFVSDVDKVNNLSTGIIRITITYSVQQLDVQDRALQVALYVI
jgi:phage baseplate assembly protein W